jgi:uncharacterized membrane protein YhdT
MRAKNTYFKDYPQAKKYARNALILTVLNIIFTLCMALIIIGLTVGFQCVSASYRYNGEYIACMIIDFMHASYYDAVNLEISVVRIA